MRHPASSTRRSRSLGFTLLEVLVSLGLGMLILLALTIMFSNNSRNQAELESNTRMLESGRYGIGVLGEDLRHAGYYGEINPNDLFPTLTTPDPCAATLTTMGWNTATSPVSMPVPVVGIASTATVACLDNRKAGTEAITVRHVDTGPATAIASMVANNLYLQVSRCNTDASQVVASGNTASMTLRNIGCTAPINSVRRFVTRTYYVATCDDCTANDGIPTLKRVEYVNGALRVTSVAEGVDQLILEYGLDTNLDGAPDEYLAPGSINGTPANRIWANVVSVRSHLLARSTQTSAGYTDPRTYRMGATTVTPADAFHRSLLMSTVRLTNVSSRFE